MTKLKVDYTENVEEVPVEIYANNSTVTLNFDDTLLPVAIKINTETAKEIIEQLQLHLGLHTAEDWELIEDELLEKISYLEEAIECKEETIDYLRNKNNKDYVPF